MATDTLSLPASRSHRPTANRRALDIVLLLALIALLVVMLFPVFIVIINSFKTEAEYYANGPFALPVGLNMEIIQSAWERSDYTTKLINSIEISLSVAVLATIISMLNAFALGIGKVRGRAVLLVMFLLAITLPPEALAYPLYYLVKALGLYDTKISLIIITAVFHSAYGTYLMTSVLRSFNREFIEAGIIDGCNKLQLLYRIIVPLNFPALSVLFVFFFIWTWNDFFLPLIFLVSNANQTVPVALALARNERNLVITTQSATALLGILPCLIFFILFQRTMARGITAGSLK
ncbi:MAG: carbohydrate ABC transporter permease [Chloroflexi bacterium]|nr:carbohydrate ABC transporter permease [Chloroflexota bacterium]